MNANPVTEHVVEMAKVLKANPNARMTIQCQPGDLEIVLSMIRAVLVLVPTAGVFLSVDFYGEGYSE